MSMPQPDSVFAEPGHQALYAEIGRAMVEMTTTVHGPDEWMCIPELWRRCMVERDQAKAERDHLLACEHALGAAYLRLRELIPGAFDTPHAPTAEQVWSHTEERLKVALGVDPTAQSIWGSVEIGAICRHHDWENYRERHRESNCKGALLCRDAYDKLRAAIDAQMDHDLQPTQP